MLLMRSLNVADYYYGTIISLKLFVLQPEGLQVLDGS